MYDTFLYNFMVLTLTKKISTTLYNEKVCLPPFPPDIAEPS